VLALLDTGWSARPASRKHRDDGGGAAISSSLNAGSSEARIRRAVCSVSGDAGETKAGTLSKVEPGLAVPRARDRKRPHLAQEIAVDVVRKSCWNFAAGGVWGGLRRNAGCSALHSKAEFRIVGDPPLPRPVVPPM
jgi:hypothetical protein